MIQDGARVLAGKSATSVFFASQFAFGTSLTNPNGICHGLSIMYLESFRRGKSEKFLRNLNFFKAETKKVKQLAMHAAVKREIGETHEKTQRWDGISAEHGDELQNDEMKSRGMSFIEKKTFGGDDKGHRALGDFVGLENSYHLISVPGHKMATYSDGRAYRFYDPNVGEFGFNSASKLRNFLVEYFLITVSRAGLPIHDPDGLTPFHPGDFVSYKKSEVTAYRYLARGSG